MMAQRPLSTGDLALKTSTRMLIERVGGLAAAASCTRVGTTVLSGYQSPHICQFIALDVLDRLEEVSEASPITELLVQRRGYTLTRLDETASESLPHLVAKLSQEFGEFHQAFAEGLADGVLCAADEAALEREITHVVRKGMRILAALQGHRAQRKIRGPA
ncbi:phage regulatory CII family protein [Teichococcus aestuarii]|uniref:phage regulatory CII family protein n=1 Tax=Teichococcus aestuarii TaxID=568898 RepID=UPI00360B3A6D